MQLREFIGERYKTVYSKSFRDNWVKDRIKELLKSDSSWNNQALIGYAHSAAIKAKA